MNSCPALPVSFVFRHSQFIDVYFFNYLAYISEVHDNKQFFLSKNGRGREGEGGRGRGREGRPKVNHYRSDNKHINGMHTVCV